MKIFTPQSSSQCLAVIGVWPKYLTGAALDYDSAALLTYIWGASVELCENQYNAMSLLWTQGSFFQSDTSSCCDYQAANIILRAAHLGWENDLHLFIWLDLQLPRYVYYSTLLNRHSIYIVLQRQVCRLHYHSKDVRVSEGLQQTSQVHFWPT